MSLRIEPNLGDIIYLHNKVNNARSSQIQKLLLSLNKRMIKEIFLIYLQYFFDADHRDKYIFNQDDHPKHIHRKKKPKINTQIINKATASLTKICKRKSKRNKRKYKQLKDISQHPFHNLSILHISDVMSFLDQKDRSIASRLNAKWFKASCCSIAKYHLKLTNSFINKKMITSPQLFSNDYDNVGSLEVNPKLKFNNKQSLRKNYHTNLISIVSSPILKEFKGDISKKMLPLYQKYLSETIDTLTICNEDECILPTKQAILKASHIKVTKDFSIWQNPYLWMNDKQSKIFSILYASEDIEKFIIKKSNLQCLDLSNLDNFSLHDTKMIMSHPIYLLWNIPSLKSCKLNMTLPIAEDFRNDFRELLSSTTVTDKAKHQWGFRELEINLAVTDNESEWSLKRSIFDNKEFNKDYATFLEMILTMYPNLTVLKCNFMRDEELQKNIFEKEIKIEPLNLKISIALIHLRHVHLQVATMKDAAMFLSELTHKKLETLALYVTVADLDTSEFEVNMDMDGMRGINEYGKYGYVIKHSIHSFVDKVCEYFNQNWNHLHSFIVDIDDEFAIHKCLKETYWSVYNKYISNIVEMIQDNKIFNGRLQFNVPTIIDHIVYEDKRRIRDRYNRAYVWTKENIEGSLKIEKLIATMDALIRDYNNNLNGNDIEEKKIILDLPTLKLHKKHIDFLQFWFNYDLDLFEYRYNHCKFIMC